MIRETHKEKERDVTMEEMWEMRDARWEGLNPLLLTSKKGGHELRNTGGLKKLTKARKQSPDGMQPC